MVTLYAISFNDKNPTFCPHSVLMCFVWISEQTAIIYLYFDGFYNRERSALTELLNTTEISVTF
jgi:hypothetical protein